MSKKYLVAGRAGSGKSAVSQELQRRGVNTFDTDDIPGLARWEDLATGQEVEVDPAGFVDYSKIGWNWQPNVLHEALKRPGEMFLCGSASNDLDFFELFAKVFVLSLDPETQRARLQERESKYGKDPLMQEVVIREQSEFVVQAVHRGAYIIEAGKPLNEVVDRVLEIVHGE